MGPEDSTSNVEYIWSIFDIPHVLSAYQILGLNSYRIQFRIQVVKRQEFNK